MGVFDLFPRFGGESACAYASRQAAIGGWLSAPSFVRSLGIVWTRLVTGEELAAASAAFGEPEAAVAFDSGRSDASSVALRGEVLSRRQWSGTKTLRFCPDCLRDDVRQGARRAPTVWCRTWWDVVALDACPFHRVRLARACACGAAVPRNAPFDGCCPSCRAFLGDAGRVPVTEGNALDGTRYVLGRLGASERIGHPVLDPYPLGDAVSAMVAVRRELGAERADFALDAGYFAFERWPRGFDGALDAVAAGAARRNGRWGAGKAYGTLHAWAVDNSDQPLAKRMAQRMAAHADRNGFSPGRVVRGRRCGGGDSVTLVEFSRMTGLSHAKASRLARAQPGTAIGGSGMPAVIDVAVARGLAKSWERSVGLSETAAALGIGPRAARNLVAAGWLVPLHDGGAGTRRTYHPEAAAGLVAKVAASLRSPTGAVVPLPVACRVMQVTLDRTLSAVLDGSVRGSVLPTGHGLASLGVVPGDLRPPGRAVGVPGLTLADVSRKLGVKWEVARSLAEAGLVLVDGHGSVDAASVDEFRATHVSAAEVAAGLGTSPHSVISRAAGVGILPAAAPPDCRKAFFRRSEIECLAPLLGRAREIRS